MKSPELTLLSDISQVISKSHDIHQTLEAIVGLVKRRMGVDCCSLYLLDRSRRQLVLKATEGLDKEAIGKVRMRPKEGLVGLVAETGAPVFVKNAFDHPKFKYFPQTREERYSTFLGVPLIARRALIGVLVVQTKEGRDFSEEEVQMFTTLASQLGSVVMNAELVDLLFERYLEPGTVAQRKVGSQDGPKEEKGPLTRHAVLKGIAASQGVGFGKAAVITPRSFDHYLPARLNVNHEPQREMARFRRAVQETFKEVSAIQKTIAETLSEKEAELFHAPLLLLEDEHMLGAVERKILEGTLVPKALEAVLEEYRYVFEKIPDPYLRERFSDLSDIARRIAENYAKRTRRKRVSKREQVVLVCDPISLISLADLENRSVAGIVSGSGGLNSHAIILAKSFEIPAVIDVEGLLSVVHDGDELIVDGIHGVVIVGPNEEQKQEYNYTKRVYLKDQKALLQQACVKARTMDGVEVYVLANAGVIADTDLAIKYGADGIGLFRSELSFMDASHFPDEEEQYGLYQHIVQKMAPKPVCIRTFDIGGDKTIAFFDHKNEANPFMGWRAIRISLALPTFFKAQLWAILRASALGDVRILLPMISSLEEVQQVRSLLEEVKGELRAKGEPFNPKIPLGIMVEIPAAALMIEELLGAVDFVSIGTNDLIQYVLAVDRNNERVASQFDPYHPAVLRFIYKVIKACNRAKKPVSVCGEMAADALACQILVGMGVRAVSVAPQFVPKLKLAIQQACVSDLAPFIQALLKTRTAMNAKRLIEDRFVKFPILPRKV
jgi:phosphotransferase system enzyme I (PtsP)